MATLTGAEVWEATMAGRDFAELPENIRAIARPYIEATPDVLQELLEKALTLQTLANAKVTFLRYCINNGFAEKISEAAGMDLSLAMESLESVINAFAPIIQDIVKFLESWGVTEEQVMLDKKIGLNAENKKKYLAGTLTIADVLRTQPAIITRNDS